MPWTSSSTEPPLLATVVKSRRYCWLAARFSGRSAGPDALVASNHGLRVQRGDRVDAGHPRLALCLIRFVHHHVNVVVDDFASDDSLGGWDAEGRRSRYVSLPDVYHVDDLAVDQDLVGRQRLGHHRRLRELPRET